MTPTPSARKSGSISTPRTALTNSSTRLWLRKKPSTCGRNGCGRPFNVCLGHTAAVYINKLIVARITNQRMIPRFEGILAVGVDEMSWDDLNDAHYDWPTLAEVKAYRDTVRGVVDNTIRRTALDDAHQLGQSVLGSS